MIEKILHKEKILSLIIRKEFERDGIEFFTPNNFSQQVGYMKRPMNYVIPPHTHNTVQRDILFTQEVLLIRSGKIRVDYYDDDHNYLESRVLYPGDVLLLAYGGHGIEMLEESEIIEVKQGPYVDEHDKVCFDPVNKENLSIK